MLGEKVSDCLAFLQQIFEILYCLIAFIFPEVNIYCFWILLRRANEELCTLNGQCHCLNYRLDIFFFHCCNLFLEYTLFNYHFLAVADIDTLGRRPGKELHSAESVPALRFCGIVALNACHLCYVIVVFYKLEFQHGR